MASKKGKSQRPVPRQRGNQSEAKKDKTKVTSEKLAANFEKAKIAEEIKLNVAAVGMDLLNNSVAATQPQVIRKVNNLMAVSSPKGLSMGNDYNAQIDGDEADNEQSPTRLIEETKEPETLDSKKIVSIANMENTEESEENITLEEQQEKDDEEDEFTRRLKQT